MERAMSPGSGGWLPMDRPVVSAKPSFLGALVCPPGVWSGSHCLDSDRKLSAP